MRSAAQAYQTIAKQTVSQRDLEADLLLKAAARLQAVKDDWEGKRAEIHEALTYNRKLWTVFLTSATSGESPLPVEVRQNVANLGVFVMSRTVDLTQKPQPEGLNALININRELAAGLRGK